MLIVHYYTRPLKIKHEAVIVVFCWDHAKCLKPKASILKALI